MQKQLVTLHVHLFLRSNSQSHRGDSIAIYLATRARPDPSISSFAITAVQVGDKIPPAWESNRIFRERHKLKLTSQFHAIASSGQDRHNGDKSGISAIRTSITTYLPSLYLAGWA